MLKFENLSAGYSKTPTIKNISFTCPEGTVTTVLGPNGCGKSTLLKSVIGLVPYSDGKIETDNKSISEIPKNILAQKIAYLSQGKNIPDIKAFNMVLHGRFPYLSFPRKYGKKDYEIAQKAMDEMGILSYKDKNMLTLSGGTRQKVYIAMALCQQTDIIILDEPATYLDINQQIRLNLMLKNLASKGKTILNVSHDIISALKFSDFIAVIKEGNLIFSGTPQKLIESNIIPQVLGVKIESFTKNGEIQYFYSTEENIL